MPGNYQFCFTSKYNPKLCSQLLNLVFIEKMKMT